jgi:hypothetical protein
MIAWRGAEEEPEGTSRRVTIADPEKWLNLQKSLSQRDQLEV